jgi:hypothetical protein
MGTIQEVSNMVFNLDPLGIELDVERRKYRLGDTIEATVTFIPSGNIEVRGASLSLMGQVRRTNITPGSALDFGDAQRYAGLKMRVPTEDLSSQSVSTEEFHTTGIVPGRSWGKDEESRYDVAIRLDPKLSKLQSLAREAKGLRRDATRGLSIEKWWLEARADVVMGPDAIARSEIQVAISLTNLAES